MRYIEHGPQRDPVAPDVLLLHGLGSNARFWDRVARHLNTRRLVALNLTPADPDTAAMDEVMDRIASAIRDLTMDRPVVSGHSWGASLALEFAVRHAELLSGLVFVDGAILGVARIFSREESEAVMQPPLPRYATLAAAIAHTRADLKDAWGEDLEPFVEAGLMRDGDELVPRLTAAVRLRILRDLYASDPAALWPRVRVPAAALIARKSDPRIARATEEGILQLPQIAPSVRIVRFQTPHDIPLYDPEGVAREIEQVAAQAETVKAQ